MHNKILCVSSDMNDCPINFDEFNYESIGADWGGDNVPEHVPRFVESNFSGCCTFHEMPKSVEEIGNYCEGQLTHNKEYIRKHVAKWLEEYKKKVQEATEDTILNGSSYEEGSRYALSKAFGDTYFCDLVYFDYEILNPIDFLIKIYNLDVPLYVVGCVDYHW